MSPLELKIKDLESKVNQLISLHEQFKNISQLDPQIIATIQAATGALTLADLADVTGTGSATSGQVLKYNGTAWAPGTDNVV